MTNQGGIAADDTSLLRLLSELFGDLRATPSTARGFDAGSPTIAKRLADRTRRRAARYDVGGREAPPAPPPDVALAARALDGDSDAVREIWRTTQGVVLGRIYAMGLGRHEDELMELVMARIWDKLSLYTGAGQASLRTWVWALTGNALRNWIRDQKAAGRTVPIDGPDGQQPTLPAPERFAADYDLGETERQASCRRMLDRIARVAAETLRREEWELVQRVIVRGERYDAISAELGELPGTLRARVFRALHRLRAPLVKELGQEARDYFAALSDVDT